MVDAADRAAKADPGGGRPGDLRPRRRFRPGSPEAAESDASLGTISQIGDEMTQDHPATQVHASLEPRPDHRSS